MPRYAFRCTKCRGEIELDKSIHDESGPLCCVEGCDGIEMQRVMSSASFHLRGRGWASDGYSKGGT